MTVPVGVRLQGFVERIEKLVAEKEAIAEQIKEVKGQARDEGFVVKIINDVVKRRALSQEERDEYDALLEIYQGALGMLGGTPLGAAAVNRLMAGKLANPPQRGDGVQDDLEDVLNAGKKPQGARQTPAGEIITDLDIANARTAGRKAASNGEEVTTNPFPANDQRRAAWDEGWCSQLGSTGIEIPAALRRSDAPKAAKAPRAAKGERKTKRAKRAAEPPPPIPTPNAGPPAPSQGAGVPLTLDSVLPVKRGRGRPRKDPNAPPTPRKSRKPQAAVTLKRGPRTIKGSPWRKRNPSGDDKRP